MVWARFISKILLAILGPTMLAAAVWVIWSRFDRQETVIYPYEPTSIGQALGFLILGLLLLSILLPILLTIREIQKDRSEDAPTSLLGSETSKIETLWR